MLRIFANDAHDALAVDHLALVAHLFYRRTNFHNNLKISLKFCYISSRFQDP